MRSPAKVPRVRRVTYSVRADGCSVGTVFIGIRPELVVGLRGLLDPALGCKVHGHLLAAGVALLRCWRDFWCLGSLSLAIFVEVWRDRPAGTPAAHSDFVFRMSSAMWAYIQARAYGWVRVLSHSHFGELWQFGPTDMRELGVEGETC